MDESPGRFPPPPEPGPPSFPPPPQGGPPPFPPPNTGPPGYPPYGYPPGAPPPQGGWGFQPPGFYPLDVGRIFSLSWSLYRFAWRRLIGIAVVALALPYALLAVAAAIYGPVIYEWVDTVERATRANRLPPPP